MTQLAAAPQKLIMSQLAVTPGAMSTVAICGTLDTIALAEIKSVLTLNRNPVKMFKGEILGFRPFPYTLTSFGDPVKIICILKSCQDHSQPSPLKP